MNRLDRGMYTAPMWWGMLLSGLRVLTSPAPMLTTVPPVHEKLAAALLFASALTCLTGSRITDLRLAYRLEIVGLTGIVLVLAWLTVVSEYTVWEQFTLAGGLVAIVQIGSIRMALRLALSLARRPWNYVAWRGL